MPHFSQKWAFVTFLNHVLLIFIVFEIKESIGKAAVKIAKEVNAAAIVSLEKPPDVQSNDSFLEFKKRIMSILSPVKTPVRVVIFRKARKGSKDFNRKGEFIVEVKSAPTDGAIFIKEVMMAIIREKWLKEGDMIVSVADGSLGVGYTGLLFLFEVDKTFFDMSVHELNKNVESDVLESVITIAKEIGKEGREGHNIGTAFIVGDSKNVLSKTRQLIINPFAGYPEEHRNITDTELKETVKEFAQLDGVFVIGSDGTIHTAGAYLDVASEDVRVPSGLGSKHLACASITAVTNAIAVVVSASGGIVRVLKKGKIIMQEDSKHQE